MSRRTARTPQQRVRGDFQTPRALADRACRLLRETGTPPGTLVEPTCGTGSFLLAALATFPEARAAFALDIDAHHVESLRARAGIPGRVHLQVGDVFATPWREILAEAPEPVWIIGNPPWVTNSFLAATGGTNGPAKANLRAKRGIDALTGDSNFDISEALLLDAMRWVPDRRCRIAMLCKESVARRVLLDAFTRARPLAEAAFYPIDAVHSFGAAVEAGLLVLDLAPGARSTACTVYRSIDAPLPARSYGLRNGRLVADTEAIDRWSDLLALAEPAPWRSGIKHDCARVMELREHSFDPAQGGTYTNGLGESVRLEPDYVYPLLKSSDLTHPDRRRPGPRPRRALIVPQRTVGDDTSEIEARAPRTWAYLMRHREHLERRASSVYRGRAPFAIFGVGPYSFALHKVAISGLYKRLHFSAIGPRDGRPVMLDDTAYSLACRSPEEAERFVAVLHAKPAQEFLSAQIFWDAKRPITVDLLRRLDLYAAALAG